LVSELESIIAYCHAEGRVCPLPKSWDRLWRILTSRRRGDETKSPPMPLILSAWWDTTDEQKRDCLIRQLTWASDHGVLDRADEFLFQLPESEWHLEGRSW